MSIEAERIRLVDRELYAYRERADKLLETWEAIEKLDSQLTGGVSSPQIKSTEAAKYQQSPKVYHSQMTDIILRKEILAQRYASLEFQMSRVTSFLQTLTDEELQLITLVYEYRYSVKGASAIMDISRRKATAMLHDLKHKFR